MRTQADLQRELGYRLQRARVSRALTQWRLATASGVSRPTIARIEAGAVAPHLSTLESLAITLGVEPEQLTQDLEDLWVSPAADSSGRGHQVRSRQ